MKTQEKELFDFLNETGKLGKLRSRLIALLLCVEEMQAEMGQNNEDSEEVQGLIKKMELILSEFVTSQKLADRLIVGLTPEQRKAFVQQVPEMLDIFGWHNKFDENGNLTKKS